MNISTPTRQYPVGGLNMLACCGGPFPILMLGVFGWIAGLLLGILGLILTPFNETAARVAAGFSLFVSVPVLILGGLLLIVGGVHAIVPSIAMLGMPLPAGLALAFAPRATEAKRDPYRCRACNYRLHGLTKPRCPECGLGFSPTLLCPPPDPAVDPGEKKSRSSKG